MRNILSLKFEAALRKRSQWRSRSRVARNADLWSALQDYLRQTRSTGCSFIDYWELYREIRTRRPVEVLECGTGVTTLVIAHALMENERETGTCGRVTSMEEVDEWLQMSRQLLPQKYQRYVDFCLSDTVEDRFSLFRGVRYRNVPPRQYDYVFVDGPKYQSPLDGAHTFDFDFLHVLRNTAIPVAGLIDKRLSTCFVLQQVLGSAKVRYRPVEGLGYIAPCTRADLGRLETELSSTNFEKSFRMWGRTFLRLAPIQVP
jgi:hypothetical protein